VIQRLRGAFPVLATLLVSVSLATATPIYQPALSFGLVISVDPTLPAPFTPISIAVNGYLPDSCYSLQSSASGFSSPNVFVNIYLGHVVGPTCSAVITPFTVTAHVDGFPEGDYTVLANLYVNNFYQQGATKSFTVDTPETSSRYLVGSALLFLTSTLLFRSRRFTFQVR